MNWKNILTKIRNSASKKFSTCQNLHDLNVVKNQLIGKNSELRKCFLTLSKEDKKNYSADLNEIKKYVLELFQIHFSKIEEKNSISLKTTQKPSFLNLLKLKTDDKEQFFTKLNHINSDFVISSGRPHPISLIVEKIHEFFQSFGFTFYLSSELESTKYNFDLLNIPKHHPSRQKTDTFFLDKNTVLRTHATTMTVHLLEAYQNFQQPLFAYSVGNVFRKDTSDSEHMNKFMQLEMCAIHPDGFSLTNLKWILKKLIYFVLGNDYEIRFRSNHFPFTEPSFEVDVRKNSSDNKEPWTEILGAGIMAPEILKKCNIKTKLAIGAFGLGIDRFAMLKYKINDIRLLYQNGIVIKR